MFKQLLGKIAGLEAAVTFNGDVIEEIRTAFDSLKKENQILKRETDKLRMEVEKFKGEFCTIKNQTNASKLAADVSARKKNVIMFGVKDKLEITQVLQKLEISVKQEDVRVKQIPTRKEVNPCLVCFPNEGINDLVMKKKGSEGYFNLQIYGT
ncbi:hypothetical protein WA026_013896 [Henosepilachna vigintioctopunctata]|uniref:Uncharacterized protein n=1 Tax=Henosepilachna vigintioctopunctata TaxID=420089 RepID=A0AAW1TY52_9CUCU